MKSSQRFADFVNRLTSAMINAGFDSTRSPSGIDVSKLCELTSSTQQNCRRYLRGEALPDYEKILKISEATNVSPGWLVFGEKNFIEKEGIEISKELLNYILEKSHKLYQEGGDISDLPGFIVDMVDNISSIDATDETRKKIIDTAVGTAETYSSAKVRNLG